MTEAKNPVHVQCKPCGHRWIAVYLPMEAVKAARTMIAARCSMCGSGSKQHFIAPDPEAPPSGAAPEGVRA